MKILSNIEPNNKILRPKIAKPIPLYKLEEMHMQELEGRNYLTQNDPNRYETPQNSGNYDDIMHWSKSNEKLPKFYNDLNLPSELKKFNIGNKLAANIVSSVTNRRNFERSFKKGLGAYIYESIKRGRLGVDLYFIMFAMVGVMVIPYYYYQKGKPLRKLTEKNRKIIDDVVEKAEGSKYDIDDISMHENYNTLYKKEIDDFKMEKFKVKREIRKLEKELYQEVPDK